VAIEVLDRLLVNGGELVTLMLGADAPEQLVDVMNRHVRQTHPEVDVEVLVGGQPHYPVLVGVE
jgi:dihydroxyacetone kinase-like predicted kinase